MIDTMLGKYRVLQRLGEGGMGTVYRARDEFIDRIVAIKVLRPELAKNPQLLARFRAEAVALARLNHPNIAILHGLEQNGEELYMVMEFLPGETVEKLIRRETRVESERAATIALDVLAALDHAHGMGVVHRDIKPANVMISPSGVVKVMDFGIARITGRDRHTRVGHTVGTPVYMSPEQLRGEDVDGRADLYAVGCMLYEMLTGQVVFDAESDYELMMKQLNVVPPRVGTLVPATPKALETIVARALEKSRDVRFESASQMCDALREAFGFPAPRRSGERTPPHDLLVTRLADLPGSSLAPAPAVSAMATMPVSREPVPFHRDWRIRAAAGALALAAIIGVANLGGSDTPPAPVAVDPPTAAVDTAGANAVSAAAFTTPAPTSASGSAVMSTVDRSPGSATPAAPPIDDRAYGEPAGGARPTVERVPAREADVVSPPPERAPRRVAPPPRRAATPSHASDRTAATPPTVVPAPRVSSPEPSRALPALTRDEAGAALADFLASFRERDAATIERAAPDAPASLLQAVRDGRLSAGSASGVQLEADGSVLFSSSLSWRSPFGANRRGTLRVRGTLVPSGSRWRLTRARILEAPDVK